MSSTIILNTYQDTLQVDEKFRIDCTKTFVHPGGHTIDSMTVEVEGGGDSFTITTDQFLDYAYSTSGTKTITVTVTHSGGLGNVTKTGTVEVKTAAAEKLFSNDSDLISHEIDILNYLPEYKADYRYAHRLAQETILNDLNERGLRDSSDNRLTAAAIVDIEEVRQWSKFKTLSYIMEGLSNAIDDIFSDKAARYRNMASAAAGRCLLRLDTNSDGTYDTETSITTGDLTRV